MGEEPRDIYSETIERLIEPIYTEAEMDAAIAKAKADTWKEAIEQAQAVVSGWRSDVNESWGERPDLSFEAADKIAGSKEIIDALQAAAQSEKGK